MALRFGCACVAQLAEVSFELTLKSKDGSSASASEGVAALSGYVQFKACMGWQIVDQPSTHTRVRSTLAFFIFFLFDVAVLCALSASKCVLCVCCCLVLYTSPERFVAMVLDAGSIMEGIDDFDNELPPLPEAK